MPSDDENLIHKIGRDYLLPIFIRLRQTFGGMILLVLLILYPILIALCMIIGYLLILTFSCTFKTFHTIVTGQWTLSMYNMPTKIIELHPSNVCSMSYISSILIFLLMGIILGLLLYVAKYIHEYIKQHHIKDIM